ncbi:hypothetical protein [Luedemannella helvata]|uniref:Uncharacterized protein n=1 Tax=Luedemannella helvata TaxID=349315 RepID=A0ABN2L263_9ACTN
MGTERLRPPFDAAAAESLLDGGRDGPPELVELLARASAPARPTELAGEAAALAAFRAAQPATPGRGAARRRVITRLLTVKAATIAAFAVGGVAIAAGTGVLPTPGGDRPSGPGPGVATSGAATGTRPAAGAPRTTAALTTAQPPASHAATAAASLAGLCQAYTTVAGKNPEKALENRSFAALVTAAGGADRVDDFCARLTTAAATAPSPKVKSSPARPTPAHPTGAPAKPE